MSAHTGLDMPAQQSHWDGCYRTHHDCAVAEVERLRSERDDDRKREYGYSQQTVDALSKERDALATDLAAARAQNQECNLLLSRVLHELAGSASLCWEPKPTGVFATELALGFVEDAIKELRAVLAGEKK